MTAIEKVDAYQLDDEPSASSAGGGFLSQLPVILWQRRWLIIIPFVTLVVAAAAAALFLPPVYRSTALIQVQSAQLPGAVTGSGNVEIVDRRIARIRQQVTSRPDLIALIQKYNLYAGERDRRPLSKVIEDMRDAIVLTPTMAEASSGRPDERTIAFELSFDYSQPQPAQAVAQELSDRILQLDATNNATQASNNVQFLTDQAKNLESQIAQIQDQITGISSRYGRVLGSSNIGLIGGSSGSYDVQIAQLQRENSVLIAQRDAARGGDNRDPVIAAAESQLAAARAVYSENHPDVKIAKQRLAEAIAFAKNRAAVGPNQDLDKQIAFNNAQIASLRGAKSQEQGQISAAMSAQSQAPVVQQKISDLQQTLSGLNEQYKSISAQLMAAKAGVRADDQMMGERLTVVDPPVVPDNPVKPNRLLILALGAAAGLGLGVVLALGIEMILSPVRDPAQLAAITGEPPLGVIPMILREGAKRQGKNKGFGKWFRRKRRRSAQQLAVE